MVVKIPFQEVTEFAAAEIVEDAFLMHLLQQSSVIRDKNRNPNRKLQEEAATWVRKLQTPTRKDEEWRFTNLSNLLETEFSSNFDSPPADVEISAITPEVSESYLTIVNGINSVNLSSLSSLPSGVWIGSLDDLQAENQAQILEKYLAQSPGNQEVFTALNTAGFADVAVVWVKANVLVEKPIQLLFHSLNQQELPVFSQPRLLVIAEKGSSLSLVEHYSGVGEQTYFNNVVTEIWLEENAQINHTRIQQETTSSFHIAKTAVSQARDSRYTINTIDLGAKLSRHNLQILQTGEQTETTHNGLTVAKGEQLADTHSAIALTKPYGKVNQLHKCIVDDRAHTVFNGKVFVPKAAQQTDAAQLNRNLLLSSHARVDTKPELQITADNVKCSHGATVSQLEADEVFYLRSRGLNEKDARYLLIDAFASEIISRLPESLQEVVSNSVVR